MVAQQAEHRFLWTQILGSTENHGPVGARAQETELSPPGHDSTPIFVWMQFDKQLSSAIFASKPYTHGGS